MLGKNQDIVAAGSATISTIDSAYSNPLSHVQTGHDALDTLESILYPSDSYTTERVYWADLPARQKMSWVHRQFLDESKRELKVIGKMFKDDPFSPLSHYMKTYALSGMGLFVEGFTLFSVGNLTPLFKATWPKCWDKHAVCNKHWIAAVDYLEITGIIFGQIIVGFQADWMGRHFGMVQDALVMALGSIMLTAMWGTSLNGWVICYAWALFIYGFGVGGEYPITGASSIEGRGTGWTTGGRLHRGRTAQLSFLMQGWGQFANQVILMLLLLILNRTLSGPYSPRVTEWTFRLQFAFIAILTLWLAYYRYYKRTGADKVLREAKKKSGAGANGYDLKALVIAKDHYWHRLFGTSIGWLCNDFFFYGNKMFSGVFIKLITGVKETSLETTWVYSLANIIVSLCGYYAAAFFMDHKMYGRKWMQANGFMFDFILFIIAVATFPQLTGSPMGLRAFQVIYFLSSFWNQAGPNATTFVLAAESFPATIRTTAHGISAASGKLGALLPAIIYNYVDDRTKLWIVVWFGLIGWIVTIVFIADTTGLDLREQERYFSFVQRGEADQYHGVAVHPRHLSLYERAVLKRHLAYDPVLDRAQRVADIKAIYESAKADDEHDLTRDQREVLSHDLTAIFREQKRLRDPKSMKGFEGSTLQDYDGSTLNESKIGALEKGME